MFAMPWSSKKVTHSLQNQNITSEVKQMIDIKEKDHSPNKENSEALHFQPNTSKKQK